MAGDRVAPQVGPETLMVPPQKLFEQIAPYLFGPHWKERNIISFTLQMDLDEVPKLLVAEYPIQRDPNDHAGMKIEQVHQGVLGGKRPDSSTKEG